MFQHMIAHQLQRRLGEPATIHGPGLPEWSWPAARPPTPRRPLVLLGHLFDLDEVAHLLRAGVCDAVVVRGWGMRLEYFPDPDLYRRLFKSEVPGQPVSDDEVLINVRAEDVEGGAFPAYYPLPFAFYDAVIEEEGRRPVFMGQLAPSPYTEALRRRYPRARFLPAAPALVDFQTIRQASRVALSISSFAWLAGWLSERAEAIHLPVAGLFDPLHGPQSLLPVGDTRYRLWSVEFPSMPQRKELDAAQWAAGPRRVFARGPEWAGELARAAITRRVRPASPRGAPRP